MERDSAGARGNPCAIVFGRSTACEAEIRIRYLQRRYSGGAYSRLHLPAAAEQLSDVL